MQKRYNTVVAPAPETVSWKDRKVHRGENKTDYSVGERYLRSRVDLLASPTMAVASVVEGITDFFAGTALQIVGDKEGAKRVYQDSWSQKFKDKVRSFTNPDGNKIVGGIQNVTDTIAQGAVYVGLAALTGGGAAAALGGSAAAGSAAATGAIKVASLAPLFLSATGSGTAEAVQTTGELGAKENVYGALTGATELATEMVLGAGGKILKGTGLIGDAASEAVKGISKHAISRGVLTSAAGEFAEEALAEAASVGLKRLTSVDPNAQLNPSDIFRAGLMGAISGGVLGFGGSGASVRMAQNAGRKIIANGTEQSTVAEASALVEAAKAATKGDLASMDAVQRVQKALDLYNSDKNATESRRAYYLGQMSEGLFEIEMYESAKVYGADIVTTVAQGGEAATKLIDGANAIFSENLGRKLTAEDFASVDSVGTKMLSAVSVYKNLTTPTDAEMVDISIRNESAVAFSPEQMASDVAALKDGEGAAVYNLGNDKMAVVTKRKGDGSISVGLIENKNTNAVKATHGIKSIEGAVSLVKSMQDGTYGQPANATQDGTNAHSVNAAQQNEPAATASEENGQAQNRESNRQGSEENRRSSGQNRQAPATPAEEVSAVEDRLRGKKYAGTTFTAEEINAARADFKYFDALSPKVRSDILIMRRSAKEAKIEPQKVKGLTRLMAAYKFSATFSSEIKSNGFWRHGKNLLVVNPNDIYQTTFGHELSHRVEDYKGYDEFASAVESLVGKARLDAEMKKYLADYNAAAEANGWEKWDAEKNAEDLRREAVANIVGKYLSNAEYIDKLANADRGFVYRIYRSIKGMKRDIALANQISTEAETSKLTEYRTIRRMEKVFEISLGLTEKQGDTLVGMERDDGISYNLASYRKKMIRTEDKDGNIVMKSGREILSDMLKKNPSMSESDIKDTLDQIDSVASELEKFGSAFDNFVKWSDASIEYNPDSGELVLTSLVKNGEYEMNIDFSTICKKRVAFTNVLNAIVRSGKDIHLTPTKIAHINTVLAEHGFETACKMCFVESKRNNLQAWAKNFVNGKGGKNAQKGWNALVKSVNPNATPFALVKEKTEVSDEDILELDHSLRSDIAANTEVLDAVIQARVDAEKKDNTESKIAKLLKEHPEYAHTLEKEDLFGSEGVTALKSKYPEVYSILLSSYGVATPKITLPAAPYASELAVASEVQKHNTKKQTVSDYTLSIGGVRVQSFSDYMVLRFFDYVQMIADGASQGMAMQSYTKEISYAYLFGKTGMKINLSIVPRVDAATVKKYGKDYAGLIAREGGTFDYAFAKESIQLEDKEVDGRLVKGAFSLINEEGYRGNVGTILIGVSRQHILKALADPRISMVIPYHKSGLNKTMASLYGIADFVDYTNVQNTRDSEGAKFKKDPFDFYASYRKHKGDSKKAADEYLAFCDENGYLPKFDEFRGDPNYYKLLIDFTSDYTDASGKRHVVQQGAVKLNLPDDWMDVVKADLGVEQKTSSKLDSEMDSIIEEVLSTDITNAQAAQRQKKLDEDVSRSVSSTDRAYLDAVKRGDMETAQRMVDEAAKRWGAVTKPGAKTERPRHLYHGTGMFGFTKFNDRAIYATADTAVAAGYNGGKSLGRVRSSSLKYIPNDNTEKTAIENAKNVLGAELKVVDNVDITNIVGKANAIMSEVSTRIAEIDNEIDYSKARDFFDYLANKYGEDESIKWSNEIDSLKYMFSTEYKAEEILQDDANWFKSDVENADKRRLDVRELYEKELDKIKAANLDKEFRYLLGYDFGDALIDIEFGLARLMDDKRKLINANGSVIYLDDVVDAIEEVKNTGIYDLYGNPGSNPLVIDEGKRFWDAIPFQGGIRSTDFIVKWAQDNGYTSVFFKSILDPSTGGSANVYADEWVFFDKNQVKSADPVTYDDDGNVIPLSDRFNAEDNDIRRSVSSRIVFGTPANTVGVKDRAKGVIETVKGIVTDKAERKAALEKLRDAADHFSVLASNSFAAVETQLRRMGDGTYQRITRQAAQEKVQLIRVAEAKGLGMLTIAQFKFDGTEYEHSEALLKFLEPVLAKKGETITGQDAEGNAKTFKSKEGGELGGELYEAFSDYLCMLNAIERDALGKNPFGNMTVAEMQSIANDYESKHPEFKKLAEKWSQFNRNLLQYRVDAGLMSQQTADELHAKYPHYIPMMKPTTDNLQSTGPVRGKSSVEVVNNIRKAKGGDHLVNDPIATYCNMVIQTVKAAQVNDLMRELYRTADDKHVITDAKLKEIGEEMDNVAEAYINDPDSNPDAFGILNALTVKASEGLTNAVYFYENGERKAMKVSKDIFTGLQGANKSGYNFTAGWMFEGMAALNSGYKRLITSMNPFFSPKNMVRDFMDGLLHSRFKLREFLIEYVRVGKDMAAGKIVNDPLWSEFIANGGLQSSLFDRQDARLSKRSKRTGLESNDASLVGKTMQTVENFNVLIEALPRFTEYKLTRNKGGTVAEAINNSAEVTTNFARAGVAGGFLNKTIMPFLNPSIQGFSKPIRNVIENATPRGLISLLIRAAMLGIVPIILNNLLYGDDEDYEVLEDSTKENNFVIKIGDSWLKIPRGRVVSVVSGIYNRSYNQMTGRYVDWKDYLENVKSQATPIDSITRTIFSPFKDVQTNTTWYGGTIENESMQNLAPEDRYDEYTSSLAIAIGKVTGKAFDVSPKKVHYLLDQYSGIIGDLLLPMTSTATRSNPLTSNFSVDVTQNTNLSDRFYKLYNESLYAKNRGDEDAYYLNKRLGETKQQISDLYKQIKEINTSGLSKAEKREQTAILRATINQLYKTAIADAGMYSKAVKAVSGIPSAYKVVKVTSANAKKLGAEKDSIGKYALTYSDQAVRFFDDAASAEEYKTSVARKTTYAEANRLVYGAQYAMNQYSTQLGEKAETVARLGVDAETFYGFYMTTRYYSGSDKKKQIEKYCKAEGLSKEQTNVLLYFAGFKSYREEVQSIAKRNGFSKSELEDL